MIPKGMGGCRIMKFLPLFAVPTRDDLPGFLHQGTLQIVFLKAVFLPATYSCLLLTNIFTSH